MGHVLYLLDPDSGMTVAQQLLDPGRDMLVACDLTQPLAWVYVEPRNTNEGTNRTAQPAASGELYVFDSKGSQLTSQEAGQVQFSQLAGDWSTKRALLARDSVGVLSVDLSSGKQSWALRDSGDVQLHLVGDGSMLWAVLPDGIRSIGTNKLVSLSQSMLASEALPGKQAKAVRTAVEALGWDWKTTVISPLSASLGRYTLFDSADPASELAELDWSPSRMHVSRLLVARQPSKDDAALATKSADVQRQQAQALLAALGWPQAKLDTGNSVSGPQGTQLTYTLDPQPKEGCSAGEFTLWQQPGTVLLTLDAATAPLPQDALSADVVRQKALAAVTQAGASSAGATTASANPTVETIRAGWVQPGRDTLVPEAEGDAKPAYEARIRQPLAQCKVYSVLLEARSGKVLALHKSDCGATQTH